MRDGRILRGDMQPEPQESDAQIAIARRLALIEELAASLDQMATRLERTGARVGLAHVLQPYIEEARTLVARARRA